MEKKIGSKEVKMGVSTNNSHKENQQKLSYEDINNVCMELSQQNQNMKTYIDKLHRQLEEMGDMLRTKRLDYLFKVIEFQRTFGTEFIAQCANEIQEALTIPEQNDEAKED